MRATTVVTMNPEGTWIWIEEAEDFVFVLFFFFF